MIAFCPTSKFRAPAELSPLRCPVTSDPLEYTDIPAFDPDDRHGAGRIWRYAAMLPVVAEGHERVTLGEGWTPLLRDMWGDLEVCWKLDALMPTGSYKDRGVSVMVNWLAGLGAVTVVDDSSGNAGASLACYAARAKLDACIYVPESAAAPKKAQICDLWGRIGGSARSARCRGQGCRRRQPHGALGQIRVACVASGLFVRPDDDGLGDLGATRSQSAGLVCCAARDMVGRCWAPGAAFSISRRRGLRPKLPRLVGVQAEPYTPLFEAFAAGKTQVVPSPRIEQISAEGIAISQPVRSAALLAAVRRQPGHGRYRQ